MDDYYQLFDVAPDADRDDIRGAYRAKRDELASQEGDQVRAKVARLNRAWNVLSDPAQRERYDERLAEHRESGEIDDEGDFDDDGESRGVPRTRAAQRAQARRTRAARQPTIVLPEGLTMAPTRSRLSALGFDLMVLLLIFAGVQFIGLKLVDNHFPGERHRGSDLLSQERKVAKKVSDDKKRVSAADAKAVAAKARHDTTAEQAAKAEATTARAAEAKDKKLQDQLNKEIDKINRHLAPWINLIFVAGVLLMLLYLVPSTAITGQTLGKRLRGIRVVRLDGSRPGWATALVRFGVPLLVATVLAVFLRFGLLGLPVAVLGMIGWISHPNRQGLHDRLAKTVVVEA
jgi:curved DNA-binding protein CbpA